MSDIPNRNDACRILVADDETPILDLFRNILAPEKDRGGRAVDKPARDLFEGQPGETAHSYDLTLCHRGEEAVEAVSRSVEEERPYSVAFLDLRMAPGISGVEAARDIRRLDPDVLIVIATAFSDAHPEEISRRVPPLDKLLYLQRPLHPQEISQFASSLCAKWKAERDLKALRREFENRVAERTESLQKALDELASSEAHYRTIFENTGSATVIIEADTTISMANDQFGILTGYSRREIEGLKSWTEFVHPEDLIWMREYHRMRRKGPAAAPEAYDFRFLDRVGQVHHVHLTLGMLPDGERSVASLLDITEKKRAEEQLVRQSLYDKLTKLPNRTLFQDRLDRSVKLSQRKEGHKFAILFLDLDRFKIINESLGHTAGDIFLTQVAERLRNTVRTEETLARFGGDEFAILIEDVDDTGDPVHLAERIRVELGRPVRVEGQEVMTTASIGIVISTGEYADPGEVLRDVDIAMYRAKNEGGDRFMVFAKAMHQQAAHLLSLETDLRKAVMENQFAVLFQPIVRMEDMRLTGFEALVRWHHPQRGVITPLEFIHVAEETGLIADIDVWVIQEACRHLGQWRATGGEAAELILAVNLSGRNLTRTNIIRDIRSALSSAGLEGGDMHIEITESTLLQSGDMAAETLNALRTLSMKLSVDDFGTGYSSLASLKSQPIDSLKIDRSFVSDMESSSESMEIVRAIVGLAHLLGLDVVAEGVETREHLVILRELGCDYAQGYLFARPMPPEEAARLVAEGLDMSGYAD